MKMIHDLTLEYDKRMSCSVNNVECYLYNDYPLISKPNDWDYALIVEVEDNEEKARVNVMGSNGKEIASLVSIITGAGSPTEMFHSCTSKSFEPAFELLDKLREYLPEQFKVNRQSEDFEDLIN